MRVEIKICGCTNADDVNAAIDNGADYIGFVIYPGSPRCISPVMVTKILGKVGRKVKAVGVFVNERREFVERITGDCGLFAVQLHGNENPDDFAGMQVPVWRAVWMKGAEYEPLPSKWHVERYVLDATVPGKYGGTGNTADWSKIGDFVKACPVMLAGGLSPSNVESAIRLLRPLGVDVVSGIEAVPGRKDHAKMKSFFDAVKKAG
ncbi:MAG: N-(5'-phosphoribosyl)anthranilate isomerase [Verrucomicrobia bacterium]|nr:N-(5'-phosphoribosyl)anthranilate isomerase [Verrucomicrobiota bacterium]